jgi:hypothetical protein
MHRAAAASELLLVFVPHVRAVKLHKLKCLGSLELAIVGL